MASIGYMRLYLQLTVRGDHGLGGGYAQGHAGPNNAQGVSPNKPRLEAHRALDLLAKREIATRNLVPLAQMIKRVPSAKIWRNIVMFAWRHHMIPTWLTIAQRHAATVKNLNAWASLILA